MKVSLHVLFVYNSNISPNKEKPPYTVRDPTVDCDKVWGFFNGISWENGSVCGLGFVLHFSTNHYLSGKANLSNDTNNMGEFSALFAFLKVALERNIHQLYVFGNYELAILWMQDQTEINNLGLMHIA
jgi:hypothetical protein